MKKILFLTISILILISIMSCGDLPDTFTITYQGNGNDYGTPPIDSKKYKSGESATIKEQGTLLKTGYDFDGWSTLSGTHYNPGDNIEMKTSLILLAVWK